MSFASKKSLPEEVTQHKQEQMAWGIRGLGVGRRERKVGKGQRLPTQVECGGAQKVKAETIPLVVEVI